MENRKLRNLHRIDRRPFQSLNEFNHHRIFIQFASIMLTIYMFERNCQHFVYNPTFKNTKVISFIWIIHNYNRWEYTIVFTQQHSIQSSNNRNVSSEKQIWKNSNIKIVTQHALVHNCNWFSCTYICNIRCYYTTHMCKRRTFTGDDRCMKLSRSWA